MSTLSTAAWIAHDLGLAAGFGGSLFGKFALGNAVKDIPSEEDRGRVLAKAWNNYSIVNALSFGIAGLTWLAGRTFISGRSIDKQSRALVIAKDVLLGTTVLSGYGSMIFGKLLDRESHGHPAVVSGEQPSAAMTPKQAAYHRTSSVLGFINIACAAGVLGVTAALAMKSGKSSKWAFLSRFLP